MIDPLFGVIVGVGIVSFLMLSLMNSLDDEKHMIIKLIILFFIVSIMLLIPKANLDAMTVCEVVVSNSTDVSTTVTAYEYEDFCYTRPENTSLSFFENTQTLYYLIIGYTIVFIAIVAFFKLRDSVNFRGGKP